MDTHAHTPGAAEGSTQPTSPDLQTLQFLGPSDPDHTARIVPDVAVPRVITGGAKVTPLRVNGESNPLDPDTVARAQAAGSPAELNDEILKRYAEVLDFFKDKPIKPDASLERLVSDHLAVINVGYILGKPTPDTAAQSTVTESSLLAAGVSPLIAGQKAAQFAAGAGLNLNAGLEGEPG
jgi:hypothetical protein